MFALNKIMKWAFVMYCIRHLNKNSNFSFQNIFSGETIFYWTKKNYTLHFPKCLVQRHSWIIYFIFHKARNSIFPFILANEWEWGKNPLTWTNIFWKIVLWSKKKKYFNTLWFIHFLFNPGRSFQTMRIAIERNGYFSSSLIFLQEILSFKIFYTFSYLPFYLNFCNFSLSFIKRHSSQNKNYGRNDIRKLFNLLTTKRNFNISNWVCAKVNFVFPIDGVCVLIRIVWIWKNKFF